MKTEDFLRNRLDEIQEYQPFTGGGLSVHLPMTLTALYRLGADRERLADYFNQAVTHLKPILEAQETFNDQSALDHLGSARHYSEYRLFFKTRLSEEGILPVLKKWLLLLAPGITAHAFHCMIRLAYALDIQHPGEVASSLAYWADLYTPLGGGEAPENSEENLKTFLNQLQAQPEFDAQRLPEALIHVKMSEVAKQPKFRKVMGALRIKPNTPEVLADIAARWYLCTGDFTALHGVTSSHALAVLLPFTDNPDRLIHYYWQALCAAYLTVTKRTLYQGPTQFEEGAPLPSWEDIRSKAILRQNEHDIKLVYSCQVEQERYKSSIYQKMASDTLGLTVGYWDKTAAKC